MNNKRILIILISIILLIGCIFAVGYIFNKDLPYRSGGEVVFSPSLGPNARFGKCFSGYDEISTYYQIDPICDSGDGGGMICSNCGDNICSSWENKCNCPEDCKLLNECVIDNDCGGDNVCLSGVCHR